MTHLHPSHPEIRALAAEILVNQGMRQETLAQFREAFRLGLEDPRLLNNLGYLRQGPGTGGLFA